MVNFTGRRSELAALSNLFHEVAAGIGDSQPGKCVLIRGRRRIGKSSLVQTFITNSAIPTVFFTASGAPQEAELQTFIDTVHDSTLPKREVFADAAPANWSGALRQLATILPDDQPSVVVIDEAPYLMNTVDAFEGILQRSWDRELCAKPVLLIIIGSDLSMMEALNSYGRPFHQRGQEMVLGPLNPADVGNMLGLDAAEAFDATIITGGLPLICAAWKPGLTMHNFLSHQLRNPLSALIVSGERSLAAEFPEAAYARQVLTIIGQGERNFTRIHRAMAGISATTLTRALDLLITKRVIAAELPLSTRPSKERHYRIIDPYLRFWLRFIGPNLPLIERMRGDTVFTQVQSEWTTWRGRVIEPLLRESLARLLPDDSLPAAMAIGSYWNRSHTTEIDIVGADRQPVAKHIMFAGSIKWREKSPFTDRDLAQLRTAVCTISDLNIPLVAVSRSGFACHGPVVTYGPKQLLAAWTQAGKET